MIPVFAGIGIGIGIIMDMVPIQESIPVLDHKTLYRATRQNVAQEMEGK